MQQPKTAKKPTNLSLDQTLLAEAKALGINLSRAAEAGIEKAVAQAKVEAWQRENAAALQSSNDWVARKGLPLAQYRRF